MDTSIKRLQPLPPDAWPVELHEIRQHLGKPLNIHSTMAHNAELLAAWMPYRYHIVGDSSLTPRHRELLILRTAVNCAASYEWEHHVIRGREAGLSDKEIERVKDGPDAKGWARAESALLSAADECQRDAKISDQTYRALNNHFDDRQLLDLISTVGVYMTIAVMVNTFDVPMEE
ncbi:MAG: carboxymuconolactone decarboxylase family protein [Gammaproteobacteria bacterium]|nr:carboxymuconolactone decarboxylase family protein [Gammaproteobacteria bacterium]